MASEFRTNLEEALTDWEWCSEDLVKSFEAIQKRLEDDFGLLQEDIYKETNALIRKAVANAFEDFFEKAYWMVTYPTEDDLLLELNTLSDGFDGCERFPKRSLKAILEGESWLDYDDGYQPTIDRLYKIIEYLEAEEKREGPTHDK